MTHNLLRDAWTNLDSAELRLFLDKRIGGPGQFDGENRNLLYLPLADSTCRIVLEFREGRISRIARGSAFNIAEWDQICGEIEDTILVGLIKIGRSYSFSSFRVLGSWRGNRSGVQILPPPDHAPRAPVEIAEHPFILEFPIQASDFPLVTNHRWLRQHRTLTLLLNVLLAGRTNVQPRRPEHFWASVGWDERSPPKIEWVQRFFFAKLGAYVIDKLSPLAGERLEEVRSDDYHMNVGHDGKGLRVPNDLDDSIWLYVQLSPANRAKFDRATFWMDMASRLWTISVSSSFASLVSAIESLTERGTTHRVYCAECEDDSQHEVPGAAERFRAFFEKYAPGASLRRRRTEMYELRSGILHGSELMQLDQDSAFGWDPPGWNEDELHRELWGITRIAMRNWLTSPPLNTKN